LLPCVVLQYFAVFYSVFPNQDVGGDHKTEAGVLQCVAVCCSALCCRALQYVATFFRIELSWATTNRFWCVAVRRSVLRCVAVCCVAVCCNTFRNEMSGATSHTVRCVAVCCSVWQRVTVCCVTVCCSMLQCLFKMRRRGRPHTEPGVLQCVAVRCSALQCVVLQCVAVCCSIFPNRDVGGDHAQTQV